MFRNNFTVNFLPWILEKFHCSRRPCPGDRSSKVACTFSPHLPKSSSHSNWAARKNPFLCLEHFSHFYFFNFFPFIERHFFIFEKSFTNEVFGPIPLEGIGFRGIGRECYRLGRNDRLCRRYHFDQSPYPNTLRSYFFVQLEIFSYFWARITFYFFQIGKR